MLFFSKFKFIIATFFIFSAGLSAGHHDFAFVKGGGTYFTPNTVNNLLSERTARISIKASDNCLSGKVIVSSRSAVPFDTVNGLEIEVIAFIDAVRVFDEHPDIVWLHGTAEGTFRFGSNPVYGVNAGQTVTLTPSSGEFIGAVTQWGRTDFVTVFENEGQPLPNFFTSSEEELNTFVEGFSYILLTNGAKPGVVQISTSGNDFTIRK